jgi:hypothetical protein
LSKDLRSIKLRVLEEYLHSLFASFQMIEMIRGDRNLGSLVERLKMQEILPSFNL